MAFKAMLNAPDMGEKRETGREPGCAAFVRNGEGWKHMREERLMGGVGGGGLKCWEEYCNFQIITLPLWRSGAVAADCRLTRRCV